jgi:hypothetical protein
MALPTLKKLGPRLDSLKQGSSVMIEGQHQMPER